METITIDKKVRTDICKELCKLTGSLYQLSSIECAYLNTYLWKDKRGIKQKCILKVTVVSQFPYVSSTEKYIKELNEFYENDGAYRIFLSMDNAQKYEYGDFRPSATIRRRKLQNACILLDRKGKYARIKDSYDTLHKTYNMGVEKLGDEGEVLIEPPLKPEIENTYLKLAIDSFKRRQRYNKKKKMSK